jgi:hypothetical protein
LREVETWAWSTITLDPFDLYMFLPPFLTELFRPLTPDHFAVSHRGHGVNSYGLGLSLRLGDVGMAVQHWWGGGYGDNAAAAQTISRWHQSLARFLNDLEPGAPGPLQSVLLFSDFRAVEALLVPSGDEESPSEEGSKRWLRLPGWDEVDPQTAAREEAPPALRALAELLLGLRDRNTDLEGS